MAQSQLSFEEQAERLLAGLNFQNIQNYMASVRWTYYDSEVAPSIERLQEAARDVLKSVIVDGVEWSSTGGFMALRYTCEGETRYMLMFVAEEHEISQNEG